MHHSFNTSGPQGLSANNTYHTPYLISGLQLNRICTIGVVAGCSLYKPPADTDLPLRPLQSLLLNSELDQSDTHTSGVLAYIAVQECAEHGIASFVDLHSARNTLPATDELQHQKRMFLSDSCGSRRQEPCTFGMFLVLPYEVLYTPNSKYKAPFSDEVLCYSQEGVLAFPFFNSHSKAQKIQMIIYRPQYPLRMLNHFQTQLPTTSTHEHSRQHLDGVQTALSAFVILKLFAMLCLLCICRLRQRSLQIEEGLRQVD